MSDILADELARLRAATPGCARVIHFNHAGASLPSQATLDVITTQLLREATMGPMEAAVEGARLQEEARQWAARLLGTESAAIAFTSSGSAAWGMAFNALGDWRPGDRILVGRHEWGGNLACMSQAVQSGARLEVIPCDESGAVSVPALERMIDSRVRLIALTWLPANGGLINPAQAIGAVARSQYRGGNRHPAQRPAGAGQRGASDFDVHQQPLTRLIFHQRHHGHGVVGIQLMARDGQVQLRVVIGFTPTLLLFLLAPLLLAQQPAGLFRITFLQVDGTFIGAFLDRHHGRDIRSLSNRIRLGCNRYDTQGQYRWQHGAFLLSSGCRRRARRLERGRLKSVTG